MDNNEHPEVALAERSEEDLIEDLEKASYALSTKEKKFCDSFISHLNAALAARDAGFSQSNSATSGFALMRRPRIKLYLALKTAGWLKKVDTEAIEVLRRYHFVARATPMDICKIVEYEIFNTDGTVKEIKTQIQLKPSDEWPEHAVAAIREVRSTREGPVVKMYDAQYANDQLARYHKLFADLTVEVEHMGGVAVVPGVSDESGWTDKFGRGKEKDVQTH